MNSQTDNLNSPLAGHELYREIADCSKCELARYRTQTVPGSGPIPCDLMFIGEAPGKNEDEQGLPFVGRSGQLLDRLLTDIGRSRESVYITNVVKCRPPDNRDPSNVEVATCADYLDRQIELVDPRVIVTLGKFAMARWFPGAKITTIRGTPLLESGRWIMPVFHPAYVLRNQPNNLPLIQSDFAEVQKLVGEHMAVRKQDSSTNKIIEFKEITDVER